jgi:hypothetical protein
VDQINPVVALACVLGPIIIGAASLMIILPIYNVWALHKRGQADLAKARNEQQVQVAFAQGRLDAAELNKRAAIIEAEAVAAQIDKIGASLTQHDLFLRWQWIRMMEEREGETIYVPTEANLPILEATRRERA